MAGEKREYCMSRAVLPFYSGCLVAVKDQKGIHILRFEPVYHGIMEDPVRMGVVPVLDTTAVIFRNGAQESIDLKTVTRLVPGKYAFQAAPVRTVPMARKLRVPSGISIAGGVFQCQIFQGKRFQNRRYLRGG